MTAKTTSAFATGTALVGLLLFVLAGSGATGCDGQILRDAPTGPSDAAEASVPVGYNPDARPDDHDPIDDPGCPVTEPITGADIELAFHWAPPSPIQSACGQEDIDNLKTLFASASAGVKFSDIKTALGATCSACAFSPMTSASWQIFVEQGAGNALDNRAPSCLAHLEGVACGKARFAWEQCLEAACSESDCGTDEPRIAACKQKAMKGACKDLSNDYEQACPNLTDDEDRCGNVFFAIAASCGGGADAGIDAATP